MCKLRAKAPAVIDLSTYVFDALRKDDEFILYRGRSKGDGSRILMLSPAAECPTPETLKRLEHEYCLKEELDAKWAARPIAMARYCDRRVLVSEDPGGVPLDQLLERATRPTKPPANLDLNPSEWRSRRTSGNEPRSRGAGEREPGSGLDLEFCLRVGISLASEWAFFRGRR
jgi:hypothetical protein